MAYCCIKGTWIPPEQRVFTCFKQLPKRIQRMFEKPEKEPEK